MPADHPSIVAVTGSTGLIGRTVLPRLLQSGRVLRLLARTENAALPASAIIPGDMTDASALHRLTDGAQELIHMAGVAHTDLRSPQELDRAKAVNVEATRRLFETARSAGVRRAVFLSSAHVYAGQKGIALREDSPTLGDSAYGQMKLEAEAAIFALASPTFNVAVLRPCLTYGPGVRFNLYSLMRAIRGGYYVHPTGADAQRSFASVDTVAAAVLHALHQDQTSAIYNVADRESVSLRAWVDQLADKLRARRPRSMPISLLRILAVTGSAIKSTGLPAPFTRDSLRKLTTPFSLDVSSLAASGFTWPDTIDAVMDQMVQAFNSNSPVKGAAK